jgi:hypothetical protein
MIGKYVNDELLRMCVYFLFFVVVETENIMKKPITEVAGRNMKAGPRKYKSRALTTSH